MVSTHLRVYGGQAAGVTGHTRPVSPFLTINKDTWNKIIRVIYCVAIILVVVSYGVFVLSMLPVEREDDQKDPGQISDHCLSVIQS